MLGVPRAALISVATRPRRVRCRIASLMRGRCLIAVSKIARARPRLRWLATSGSSVSSEMASSGSGASVVTSIYAPTENPGDGGMVGHGRDLCALVRLGASRSRFDSEQIDPENQHT
jgi:hypothetical protein